MRCHSPQFIWRKVIGPGSTSVVAVELEIFHLLNVWAWRIELFAACADDLRTEEEDRGHQALPAAVRQEDQCARHGSCPDSA